MERSGADVAVAELRDDADQLDRDAGDAGCERGVRQPAIVDQRAQVRQERQEQRQRGGTDQIGGVAAGARGGEQGDGERGAAGAGDAGAGEFGHGRRSYGRCAGLSSPRGAIGIPTEGDAVPLPRRYVRAMDLVRRWGDWALAVGLTAEAWWELAHADHPPASRWLLALLLALFTLPLAYRQRAPLAVAAAMIGVLALGGIVFSPSDGPVELFLALILLFYSIGAHADDRRTVAGGAAALAAVALVTTITERNGPRLGSWLVFAGAWLVGRELRRHRREAAAARELAARAERDAAAAERARIARELHDVVAHSVSVMVVQAQAARARARGRASAPARELLGTIEGTGRQALVELRRLLGLLRRADDELELAPQPGLGELDELVAQIRGGGPAGRARVEGERAPLPAGIELSAYRIVQEALTNALKHAGRAQRARAPSATRPSELELEIVDDGPGAANGSRLGQRAGRHARARRAVRRGAGERPGGRRRLRRASAAAGARERSASCSPTTRSSCAPASG